MTRDLSHYKIEALDNGLRLLEAVAMQPGRTLTPLAEACGMTLSQAYRVAATLQQSGYLTVDENKRYHLGLKCLKLGDAATHAIPLIQLAADEMDFLARETQESISLVVREGLSRVTVDLRDSPHAIRVSAPIGEHRPLHFGATGQCILAFSAPDVVDRALAPPLGRATEFTDTDPNSIRARLQQIRERKYHVAIRDYADHAFAVGAPIQSRAGDLVGAISISGPLARFDDQREKRYVALVTAAAARVSQRL
ncbi:IclR family transcriptional regulator [Deinococcus metallilatus]|uniref:DNA-binding IclR family transcriptional regulator n=1 Tax=Deinococcus metallilatus TaxID=1211322 RepID=A0ABR6MWG4_9DEIO|nr:IclR family transcriptional regulator [Deinococcus metallilatus]MBB5295720.1 DNA-binding IclR family transcriptional regulator [Deinococcus metallilatus]GMA14251.1 IclR family transcriptional regulator [Deinococcus metallilatus]